LNWLPFSGQEGIRRLPHTVVFTLIPTVPDNQFLQHFPIIFLVFDYFGQVIRETDLPFMQQNI
jgi:hypothetical protein